MVGESSWEEGMIDGKRMDGRTKAVGEYNKGYSAEGGGGE